MVSRRNDLHIGDSVFLANVRAAADGDDEMRHALLCGDGFNHFSLAARQHGAAGLDNEDCLFRFCDGSDYHVDNEKTGMAFGSARDVLGSPRDALGSPRDALGSPRADASGDIGNVTGDADGGGEAGRTGTVGERLYFGQTVQLQHVKSGCFVTASTRLVAERDTECMQLSLEEHASPNSQFKLVSVLKIQTKGMPVCSTNSVRLQSCAVSEHFVHTSSDEQKAPMRVQLPFDDSREVNLSARDLSEDSCWQLLLYRSQIDDSSAKTALLFGAPFSFLHTQTDAFLHGTFGSTGPETAPRMGWSMQARSDAFNVNTFFSFESVTLEGGVV